MIKQTNWGSVSISVLAGIRYTGLLYTGLLCQLRDWWSLSKTHLFKLTRTYLAHNLLSISRISEDQVTQTASLKGQVTEAWNWGVAVSWRCNCAVLNILNHGVTVHFVEVTNCQCWQGLAWIVNNCHLERKKVFFLLKNFLPVQAQAGFFEQNELTTKIILRPYCFS